MFGGFVVGVLYAYAGILVLLIGEEAFEHLLGDSTARKLFAALVFPVSAPVAVGLWFYQRRQRGWEREPW